MPCDKTSDEEARSVHHYNRREACEEYARVLTLAHERYSTYISYCISKKYQKNGDLSAYK